MLLSHGIKYEGSAVFNLKQIPSITSPLVLLKKVTCLIFASGCSFKIFNSRPHVVWKLELYFPESNVLDFMIQPTVIFDFVSRGKTIFCLLQIMAFKISTNLYALLLVVMIANSSTFLLSSNLS